jgi:SAM-dependent methyltransferase
MAARSLHTTAGMRSPAYEPSHCIVCGHADAELVADEDDIRGEVETLWAFHQRRLRTDTPVERLRDRVAFSQDPPWRLVACRECGLVYRNPAERGFEVESIYARDCPPRELLQSLHETQRRSYATQAHRLAALVPSGATVLEVGSYVGAFLAAARDAGLKARGVDINPSINGFTRSMGFQVHDGELATMRDGPVDAIAIWNTFDQLSDPRAVLAAAGKLVRSGGVLAIRVPNGAYYRNRRSRSRGRLALNNLLGFPYRWGFSPRSIRMLLEQAGFEAVKTVGDVLVPTADEWTRPWARIEERFVKFALGVGRSPEDMPWFETYSLAGG